MGKSNYVAQEYHIYYIQPGMERRYILGTSDRQSALNMMKQLAQPGQVGIIMEYHLMKMRHEDGFDWYRGPVERYCTREDFDKAASENDEETWKIVGGGGHMLGHKVIVVDSNGSFDAVPDSEVAMIHQRYAQHRQNNQDMAEDQSSTQEENRCGMEDMFGR